MGVHIAVVGNGRIGRPTAYTLFNEMLADEFSVIDTKPGLAWAFAEELNHVAASLRYDVKINSFDDDEGLVSADLVVVCPGKPRVPGVKMDRRDLVAANAKIIKYIAEVMPPRNPKARWVIVTNPVDAMATLFKRISGAKFVISTGDHPDTLRYRSRLSRDLDVPISKIEGFIGGEHGSAAFPLWSTVRIGGKPLNDYLSETGKNLDRNGVLEYVRSVSKEVVDVIGGTEVGPASGFRDIVRSILQNRKEIYSIAQPLKLHGLPEEVNVSVPTQVGLQLGPNILDELPEEERVNIVKAAEAIYANYLLSLEAVGET
jgi:malate dehydrogenase